MFLHLSAGRPKSARLLLMAAVSALVWPVIMQHAALAGETGSSLVGQAFTDTSYRVPMPEEWVAQPIEYEGWARGSDLAVTLDQHLFAAYEKIIRDYAKKNNLKIAVNEGTCGISAGMLARKAVDIAGFCCPAGKSDRLPGIRFHTVGIASLALIVHPDIPLENITSDEARKVFMGEYYNWSELGSGADAGPDAVIRPVGRLHCKTRPGHWRLILDNEDLFSIRLQEVGTIPDLIM